MRGYRDICQSYLVLSLFYNLQRGSNGFIAEKTILILTLPLIQWGSIIFLGWWGGVKHFPGGGSKCLFL